MAALEKVIEVRTLLVLTSETGKKILASGRASVTVVYSDRSPILKASVSEAEVQDPLTKHWSVIEQPPEGYSVSESDRRDFLDWVVLGALQDAQSQSSRGD